MTLCRPFLMTLLCGLLAVRLEAAPAPGPKIEHAPVTIGVRGQNVVLRAQVTSESQGIQKVSLFYAVSRDAAPFRTTMDNTGAGSFTGTIPGNLTAGLNTLLYYIEARDAADATAETPWYTIELKSSLATPAAPVPATVMPTSPAPAADGAKDQKKGESSWTKPALIAGGLLLVGGAVVALSQNGGDSGGSSSSGGSTTNAPEAYAGSATLCFQPPDASSSCATHPVTITIDQAGNVSSDTLHEGTHLEGKLSGANFLLVTSVQETNRTGEIQYLGTLVNNRIAGSIQGSATTPAGTGTYSGNFSAVK